MGFFGFFSLLTQQFSSFTKGEKKELQCKNATNVKHDTTSILLVS